MVKALSFFKRRAGMPVDEFQAYWRTRQPDVVTKLPGVRRYVQSHTRAAAYERGEPVYDGIAEVWFDDTAAMHALRGTAEVAAVQADEARFIDRPTMGLIITDDHVIKDGAVPPGAAKGVGFARRKSGMTVDAFRKHWREVHGPLGAAVPSLRRYVQSHPRPSAYDRGREPGTASRSSGSTTWRRCARRPRHPDGHGCGPTRPTSSSPSRPHSSSRPST